MTESEVLAIAKQRASESGWPWLDPVQIRRRTSCLGNRYWSVWTNSGNRGCNVRLVIDDATQSIKTAAFLPR